MNVKKEINLLELRDMTDIFAKKCKNMYKALTFGTVDDELVKSRGRCSLKVHMSNKPEKYGFTVWMLCGATAFYSCNQQVYLG